jgi:hypothetical protein
VCAGFSGACCEVRYPTAAGLIVQTAVRETKKARAVRGLSCVR